MSAVGPRGNIRALPLPQEPNREPHDKIFIQHCIVMTGMGIRVCLHLLLKGYWLLTKPTLARLTQSVIASNRASIHDPAYNLIPSLEDAPTHRTNGEEHAAPQNHDARRKRVERPMMTALRIVFRKMSSGEV